MVELVRFEKTAKALDKALGTQDIDTALPTDEQIAQFIDSLSKDQQLLLCGFFFVSGEGFHVHPVFLKDKKDITQEDIGSVSGEQAWCEVNYVD